jgi:MFS family permease
MFAALSVPNFRRYVVGQSLSLVGTWVETVAQGLLVLQLTHSGTILGLTTAARYGPILLLSPSAGLLVDRYPKRRVLLATQTGLGLVSAVLGASVLTGEIRLWQVVVLGLVFGTFSAVDNPARQAFVQEVVGRDLVAGVPRRPVRARAEGRSGSAVTMALDYSRRQSAEATAWQEVSASADFGQPYPVDLPADAE